MKLKAMKREKAEALIFGDCDLRRREKEELTCNYDSRRDRHGEDRLGNRSKKDRERKRRVRERERTKKRREWW